MSQAKTNLKSFRGVVQSVITTDKDGVTPLMKTRADGSKAPYALCGVKFTEGPLAGKTTWAQRTLANRDGVTKEAVAVGDEISIVHVGSLTNDEGKVTHFFEVATSMNASDEDLMAVFGDAVATSQEEEVKVPLATATAGAQ